MSFEDKFGEVEDEDWEKIATVDVGYEYIFELKDKGKVTMSFSSRDDGFGQADIQEDTTNARDFDAYLNGPNFRDIDEFISDFEKSKTKKKKKTVAP